MKSRGRAFGGIRATASTCSSGFLSLLHCAHLSFAVELHVFRALRRQCQHEDASLWHAEDCGRSVGACRCRVPQASRRRQGDTARWRPRRSSLSAGASGLSPRGHGWRGGHRLAFRLRQWSHADAWGACPSVEFRLTTASIVSTVARGLPDAAGLPACEKL
jgi:hypothetical protein